MKLKVHIDTKGYMEKPTGKEVGRIKIRLQKNTSPSIVTVEELIQKIRTGHSISPGIMEGMSTKDWKEQQLFLVDIDNEENGPILYFKDAKRICAKHGLSPAFIYQTFNYCKEKPKFRIAFIMETPVTDEAVRKRIIETLVKLFPQSDKSCVNADRIFHGTNKRVILLSESARISWESIRNIHLPSQDNAVRHISARHTASTSALIPTLQRSPACGKWSRHRAAFCRETPGASGLRSSPATSNGSGRQR